MGSSFLKFYASGFADNFFAKLNEIDVTRFGLNELNIIGKAFMKYFYDQLPDYLFYRQLLYGLFSHGAYNAARNEIFLCQNNSRQEEIKL